MTVRGVRGATTAVERTQEAVIEATVELVDALVAANGINPIDIAAAYFTASPDLFVVYPASAARMNGWDTVPLLSAQEIAVPGGQERCIRILILWNTDKSQTEIKHLYLRETRDLRKRSGRTL